MRKEIILCDRCGKEVEAKVRTKLEEAFNLDLCDNCFWEIIKFANRLITINDNQPTESPKPEASKFEWTFITEPIPPDIHIEDLKCCGNCKNVPSPGNAYCNKGELVYTGMRRCCPKWEFDNFKSSDRQIKGAPL